MKIMVLATTIVFCVFLITLCTPAGRIFKSIFLIAVAQPYQQRGETGSLSILIAGDSTGYGTGTYDSRKSIAGRIGTDFPNAMITNISKNSATTEELVELLKKDEGTYSLVLLQIGGNDILQKRSVSEIEPNIRAAIALAKQKAEHVVLMTVGNVGAAKAYVKNGTPNVEYQERSQKVLTLFAQVAQEEGVEYIDQYAKPENDPFFQEPKKYFAIDGLHPNGIGYGQWYTKLQPVLLPLLSTE